MKKRLAGINEHAGKDTVIRLDRRPLDEHPLDGFVVALNDKLLLLHVVDGSTLTLNGYAVVRLADVHAFREDETFVSRALRLLDRTPLLPPEIDLADWASALISVQARYPLLMIEMEKKEPARGFVGRVTKHTAWYVELKKVNTKALWTTKERFAFKDITQVGFGDSYVNALAQLVTKETAASETTSS